jgi:hypothetical protein
LDQESELNKKLYVNSSLNLGDFNVLLMSLLTKLSLPETHAEMVYEFVQLILPDNNTMIESYYRFNKSFKNPLIKQIKLCHICRSELINNTCPRQLCYSKQLEKEIVIKKSIKIIVADIKTQIITILSNHYETMVNYKHKMNRSTEINDICNGKNYKLEENTINLILFTDAVTYTKSVDNQMWAIFTALVELPPALRSSYENIILNSIWSGDLDDFNLYLKEYNSEIDELLKDGIKFKDLLIFVKVHVVIGDTPARCKALNCIYFNGNFGCIMCYHPTARHSNRKTIVYPFKDFQNIKLRKQSNYLNDLNLAITTGVVQYGVKGNTHLYNWISLPDSIIIDYMHLCLIGSFKRIICFLFETKNKNLICYTGIYLTLIIYCNNNFKFIHIA